MSIAVLTAFPALQSIASASELTFNPKIIPITVKFPPDYDRLCKAISYAETGGCKDGTARGRNNCHGIMTWDKNGVRSPRYFKSHAESHAACVALWKRSYVEYPDYNLAKKWTGADNTANWLATVNQKYKSL